MTRKEQILRASSIRMRLWMMMGWFDQAEHWESYLQCAVLFHEYDRLLKKLKEKKYGHTT